VVFSKQGKPMSQLNLLYPFGQITDMGGWVCLPVFIGLVAFAWCCVALVRSIFKKSQLSEEKKTKRRWNQF
jgi:hypothetical protein